MGTDDGRPATTSSNPLWNATLYFFDKTQEVVTALTAAVILYTHFAPGAVYFTVGAVAASRVAKGLKLLLRESRPELSSKKDITYGMPSTHSAVIIYYCTYVSIASMYLKPEPPYSMLPAVLPPLVIVPWGVTIAVSRIWLGHHTVKQVCVGSLVGTLFALGWFSWWTRGADQLTEEAIRFVLQRVPFMSAY